SYVFSTISYVLAFVANCVVWIRVGIDKRISIRLYGIPRQSAQGNLSYSRLYSENQCGISEIFCRFLYNITGDFYTLKNSQKTGGLYQIVAQTKTRINTGFLRCQTAENGLYQNVIKTSFVFKNCVAVDKEKLNKLMRKQGFSTKVLIIFLLYVIIHNVVRE
ncbi:MAG: hypothetical protein IJB70_03505, partial [Clostridia bacterium]|nr:hypothetical protein [Clostridia bacterium]